MRDESKEQRRQRLIEELQERDAPHPKALKDALAHELACRRAGARENARIRRVPCKGE
jgi:hypothetical protein